MNSYQVGPKVKENIKETINPHLGPSKQRKKEGKVHIPDQLGQSTNVEVTQAHQANHQTKVVLRQPSQGAAVRCGCTGTAAP